MSCPVLKQNNYNIWQCIPILENLLPSKITILHYQNPCLIENRPIEITSILAVSYPVPIYICLNIYLEYYLQFLQYIIK